MAKRRRPEFDMFDVASGKISLDDYLAQRYSEVDLQSKVWVEKEDKVEELLAPPTKDEPMVVRQVYPLPADPPPPDPRLPAAARPVVAGSSAPMAPPPVEPPSVQDAGDRYDPEPPAADFPAVPDFESLLSQFHEAARDFEERNRKE
ncbi:MAG: hypothetical protein AB7S38_02590 [Vulcanimicrobiota bacterium]